MREDSDTSLLDGLNGLKAAGLGLLESWGRLNGLYRTENGDLEEDKVKIVYSAINATTSAVRGVTALLL